MTDTYELPEPAAWMFRQEAHDTHNGMGDTRFVRGPCDGKLPGYRSTALFTADQMRAYGQEYALLAVKAERERAGKLCEAIANGWISGKEFGMSGPEVAHMIAAAIRQGDKP